MAEGLLFSIAEGILGKLGSRALQELGLLWGVKDELEKLQDTADDLLDDFSTEGLLREMMTQGRNKTKQVRIFFSKSNQLAYRFKMARKIKKIREKLDAIQADRKFHLEPRNVDQTGALSNKKWNDSHSCVVGEQVIGREDDKKAVIELLMDSNIEENVSILAIVGIGGLGKTTLAKHIFNDEKIKESFEVKMWVCVSENFEVQKIVEEMLELATKKKPETTVQETLVADLKKEIDGKKYFLVLDDLWNEDSEKWMSLKTLLVGGARGSRILVTTRTEKVAKIARAAKQYSLRGLGEDASWCLFKQMAFDKGEEPKNSRIVAIGKEILEKCVGVPLAIRIIGRLLYLRNSETEWLSFKTNELLRIKQNDILPTLRLSYDKLPPHLKHCFAYCSLFPKDCHISKSMLVKLWMAQGFIHLSDQDQCFEDVGNEYFLDLLWRSFFQEAKVDEYGDVISCKMHDLMHDLAVSVAGSLITTFDCEKEAIDVKARHLWIDDRKPPRVVPNFKENRMRTIIFQLPSPRYLRQHNYDNRTNYLSTCDSLKFLRALDVSSGRFLGLECSIGDLKQLRYLDLSDNDSIRKLPDSITRLQNLQTLSLNGCSKLQELHKDMKNLVNLRHLEIEECDSLTHMPGGMGQMTNLQTLSKFVVSFGGSISVDSGGLNELKRLNNLRGNLVIEGLRHGKDAELEYKAADLKEKQYLQSLHLKWSRICEEEVVCEEMLWEGNLQYLPPLSQLPSLESLSLYGLTDLEYIQSDNGNSNNMFSASSTTPFTFFPSLKRIHLDSCLKLKGWWRRDPVEITSMTEQPLIPSFPRLSSWEVQNCPMLTSTPTFPHLEENLYMWNASWKPVQQTMMMYVAAPQCPSTAIASSFNPLSKLKRLQLLSIADLQSVPEEGLRNLIGLQYLSIWCCYSLQSLSRGIQHLTALQELELSFCNELDLGNDKDGMQWQGLTSLRSLKLDSLPKLEFLPPGLQHLTTLRQLHIRGLGFTALPEWIHNWTSLEDLTIRDCPSLASLPEGMRRLTSLQTLKIDYCAILSQDARERQVRTGPRSLTSQGSSSMRILSLGT
ncbi:putative disease resistance protein RGA4 [Morella rubra]|uniref:Putative disease resistance protein RGA4 n=1 Tax=Morella rubra TaxID=262757 RepID=A0A6A1WV75_9ROSI|nr:putative disease resistance protein RGA4 [Morella rubra]